MKQTFPFLLAALILTGCSQQDRPADVKPAVSEAPATSTDVAQPSATPESPATSTTDNSQGEELVVTDLSRKGAGSQGTEIYVRVTEDGRNVVPISGVGPSNWADQGGGVYLRVVPEGTAENSIVWRVASPDKSLLYFSNTAYSGQVRVKWRGAEKTYDLYSAPNSSPRGPVSLKAALPDKY